MIRQWFQNKEAFKKRKSRSIFTWIARRGWIIKKKKENCKARFIIVTNTNYNSYWKCLTLLKFFFLLTKKNTWHYSFFFLNHSFLDYKLHLFPFNHVFTTSYFGIIEKTISVGVYLSISLFFFSFPIQSHIFSFLITFQLSSVWKYFSLFIFITYSFSPFPPNHILPC